ncbi:hypothetical protein [Streptomyces sp. MAI_2237]
MRTVRVQPVRCGRGFRYRDRDGRPLTDSAHLARIRALVIPPAWRDVWICPWPNGHLQAVGTDDAGRRASTGTSGVPPHRAPSRPLCWNFSRRDLPEPDRPVASYAELHDRTSSSLHLSSADHGARSAAGHTSVPDRGDRRRSGR